MWLLFVWEEELLGDLITFTQGIVSHDQNDVWVLKPDPIMGLSVDFAYDNPLALSNVEEGRS